MSLANNPIPATPEYFGPDGAPPGVALQLDAFETLDDGYEWLAARPTIKPRVGVVHTNAAPNEGSLQSQLNWGRSGRNRTKPHYCVNRPQPTKTLATDRRGIANSTAEWIETQYGERDVSHWSFAIETADTGTNNDPDVSDFLPGHAEIVARILAYESIVWNIPLDYPDVWNGTGMATHTDPFPYPYYTTAAGKTCPGAKKKRTVREQILPRARQIKAAWTATPQEEDLMLVARLGGYADQFLLIPLTQESKRRMGLDDSVDIVLDPNDSRNTLNAKFGYDLSPM